MFSWKRPQGLGVRDGRLAACKRSPNCVSSQANPVDAEHYIAPLHASMGALREALHGMARVKVVAENENYVYAEFRTPLMRFVDDVEFYFDGTLVHVRSCSRLGRRDFGTNRRRIERLRALIER
jgi:uncharacterized protein (DUF1499 family)